VDRSEVKEEEDERWSTGSGGRSVVILEATKVILAYGYGVEALDFAKGTVSRHADSGQNSRHRGMDEADDQDAALTHERCYRNIKPRIPFLHLPEAVDVASCLERSAKVS
jgi:hypothetical protein